jgi:HlyD family secretion protein
MRVVKTLSLGLLLLATIGVTANWYLLPSEVKYYAIKPRPLDLEITGPGILDAIDKVVMTARIQGFLFSVKADKNDKVKQAQILAELESTDLKNQLLSAQANAKAAASGVAEAESDRDRLVAALDRAQQDFDRKSILVANNTVSKAEFMNAEASLKEAKASVARATTGIDHAKAQLVAAEADVKVLQVKYSEATIRSPIDGVVISRERNVGDLLTPGAALMQIVNPASIIVSARFDESTMNAIHRGDQAKVRFAADPARDHGGHVLRLTRQVDQETREFTADIVLNDLPEDWALGQRAQVTVITQSAELVIAVPKSFVVRDQGRPGVWIGRDGRAVWKPISVGFESGAYVQIRSGLATADVVLDPTDRYAYQAFKLGEASQ